MDSGNGYDLLWRVMALSVPGFDPTLQVSIPAWHDDDIFDFALSFLLYFRLQAKKGVVQDDRTNSIAFLHAITEPAYADAITTLSTCITNYVSGIDDGYLPQNLCIMGLATQLHTNARTRAHAVIPRVRRTLGMSIEEWNRGAIIQGSRGSPVWRTNVPPFAIIVGVVGIHDRVHHAHLSRAAKAMDARNALPVGVLLALTVMMAPFARTRYVMHVVVPVTLRLTAVSWQLPCSLRNTNGISRMMYETKLKLIGWRVGVRQSAIRQRNHVG